MNEKTFALAVVATFVAAGCGKEPAEAPAPQLTPPPAPRVETVQVQAPPSADASGEPKPVEKAPPVRAMDPTVRVPAFVSSDGPPSRSGADGAPGPAPTPVRKAAAPQQPAFTSPEALLTQTLRTHLSKGKPMPASIQELVDAGALRRVPVPPPGKKYVIDAEAKEVKLQDQ